MSEIYYDVNGNVIQPQSQTPAQYGQQSTQNGYAQSQAPMAIDPNNIPAHLRKDTTERSANALDAGAGIGGPRLSIKGKQFRFIEGDNERPHPFGQPLHVVMITADPHNGVAKNFYEGSYVEGEDASPVCYSSDGETPDSGAEKPQCATCAACPHNKFGTAVKQDGTMGKGKACRDFKRVYVIPYDQPASEVYEMRIPPTSFKGMQTYGLSLARANLDIHGVVTTLNFAEDTSPVVTFTFSGYVDPTAYAKIDARLKSGELDAVLPSKNKSPAVVAGPSNGRGLTHQPETGHVDTAGHSQAATGQGAPAEAQSEPVQPPTQPVQQTPPAAPNNTPCPLGAPAGFKMTEKGAGVRYEAFAASPDWNDQLMVQHGYMVQA